MQMFVGDGVIVAALCECVGCVVELIGSVFSKDIVMYSGYAISGLGLVVLLVTCLSTVFRGGA